MWHRHRNTRRQLSARAGHRRKLAKETLESRVVLSATIGNHIEIGTEMRNYRLAIAATAEYTALLGGQAAALSSIEAFVDEVNHIFENELAIHFDLVSGSNTVFTDSSSDGYTNGAVATMAGQNTDRLNTVLGNGDPLVGVTLYDIGHVFGTAVSGSQGIGGLGVVNTNNKGLGASISSRPVGPDWVKLVAHEFAHQFNAEHIFNGDQFGATVGQRSATNAYEPASGSSLMSYAGIAGPDNLQDDPDGYLHAASFEAIQTFIASTATPHSTTPIANSIPVVDGGADYTLPAGTPFALTASGSDADTADVLRYTWEQLDLGPAMSLPLFDNGSGPLFRSYPPGERSTRAFPRLADLAAGVNTAAIGEVLPTTNRDLNFRATIRDGRGGVNSDDVRVTVVNTGTPFAVSSPNTAVNWTGGTTQTVTWNVAGTDTAPINTASVSVDLSLDGGLTYPFTLLSGTGNDGSETVVVPNVDSEEARVRVRGEGNIFFDLSDTNFSITADATSPGLSTTESGGQTWIGEDGLLGSSPIDSYQIALNTAPTGPVEVTVTADNQTEVSLDGVGFDSSVVIARTDTSAATVFVRGRDDLVQEGIHSGTITHSITASGDPNYPLGPIGNPVHATIADDELQPVIGIDFGGDPGSVPENWTFQETLFTPTGIELTNLIREDGVPTGVGLSLPPRFSSGGSNTAAGSLPFHSPSLEGIDGNVLGSESVEMTWTGLTPGQDYHVYVLTSENFGSAFVQELSIDSTVTPRSLIQDTGLIGNQLYVNGGVARPDRPIEHDALLAQADAAGEIRVVLTDLPGGAKADALLSAAAIQQVAPGTPGIDVFLTDGGTSVSDSGTGDTFGVSLKTRPDGPVVIQIGANDASELSVTPVTLSFDSSNWAVPQSVTAIGVEDGISDGVQRVSAVLSIDPVSTLDSQYDLVAERLVHITATDNQMLPLVGVDFEASSGTNLSPVNWNFAGQSSTSGFTLTDLSDEEGNATSIDLSVVSDSALTGFDAPPATNLPQHPNPLDQVAGILYSSSSATLIWSDLKAGAAYDLWIMGASSFTNPFGQTVTIDGGDPNPLPFNMDYTVVPNNTLRISSSVGSPVLNFNDYAIRANADSNGQIRLLVDKMPNRQFIAFGAVAIREVLSIPSFDAALAVTTEGDETGPVDLVYTVTLDPSNTTGGPILFDFRDLGSGTAQAGSDYLAIPGDATIVVPDGSSTGTYTVSVIDDPDVESLETVIMRIANPSVSSITLSTSTALATIRDNDATSRLIVDVQAASVSESAGSGATEVTVTRTGDWTDPLELILTSSDPSEATLNAAATIPAGQASVTVDLDAVDDSTDDGDQVVRINATTAGGFVEDGDIGLDVSFGIFGKQPTTLQSIYQPPWAVLATLPDGKILAASEASAQDQIMIVRHQPDGSVDTSFGNAGTVLATIGSGHPTFGPNHPAPRDIVVAEDGSFFIGGVYSDGTETPFLAKFQPDGTLETNYGAGGLVDLSSIGFSTVAGLDLTDDGKLIAAIRSTNAVIYKSIRVNPDGRLDASFGDLGRAEFPGIGLDTTDIHALDDGKFLLLGNGPQTPVLLRVDANGKLDRSFGFEGAVYDVLGFWGGRVVDLDVDSDGRIVVAGTVVENSFRDFGVARLNYDGTVDTTFDGDGVVTLDVDGNRNDVATSLEIGVDNKPYVVGYTRQLSNDQRAVIVRLNDDGSLDTTFDTDGKLVTSIGSESDQETLGSAPAGDGGLLILGGNRTDVQIARINTGVIRFVGSDSLTVTDDEGTLFFDFGDAPSAAQSGFASSYPVTAAESGAAHNIVVGGPRLGFLADSESGGVHSPDATFDDTNGSDDEDGVTFPSAVLGSSSAVASGRVIVELQNASPTANYLDAWIDFNRDGDWNDAGEQIFDSVNLGTSNGGQELVFDIPADSGDNFVNGTSFARFRISSGGGLDPFGVANDGEVEDVAVMLISAEPLMVDTLIDESDGDFSPGDFSLREAIEIANELAGANEIRFASSLQGGTIALAIDELVVTDDLTIRGLGAGNLTVSGQNLHRVFRVDRTGSLTLDGLTVANGRPNESVSTANGGGISALGDLELRNVVVDQNRGGAGSDVVGGGIFINSAKLTLSDSVVSNNSLDGTNSAGGGIYAIYADVSITRSVIDGNATLGDNSPGAGILVIGDLTMDQSTVSNNVTRGSNSAGGGVVVAGGNLTLTNSTIHGNATTGPGAGIAVDSAGMTAEVTNSTISGNNSGTSGGGIAVFFGTFHMNHSTVTDNAAAVSGSGVAAFGSAQQQLTFYSSLVAGNTGTDLQRVLSPGPTLPPQAIFSGGFNVFGQTDTPYTFLLSSDQNDVAPRLAALADNGGPTPTHALLANSPAVDAGETSSTLAFDQRGSGFPRLIGSRVDVGAFEAAAASQLSVAATDASKSEGDTGVVAFTFTVTRSGSTAAAVSVDYAVSGSGAAPATATDFSGGAFPSGSVQFAAEETSRFITVNVLGDAFVEPDQGFTVTLSNPSNPATITTGAASGTIVNDDQSAVSVTAAPATIGEDDSGGLVYTFTRDNVSPESPELTVSIRFDGTATAGSDYAPTATTTVTFAAAAPTATLEFDAIADSVVEPNESVVSTVLPGTGYVVGSDATATATILNDDLGGPTVQVVRVVYFNEDAEAEQGLTADGTGQRSIIRKIQVVFSGPVDVPVGPVDDERFVVTAITGRATTAAIDVEVVRSELINGQQIVTLKFAGKHRIEPLSRKQPGEKAMLVDGRYRLTIDGAALGIDANGLAPGTDSVDEFFRLFGDHDGDGDVDHLDYKRFLDFYADNDHEAVFNFHDHARHRQRDRLAFMRRFGNSL